MNQFEKLIQLVENRPEEARAVLETMRDSLDEKREAYIKAASEYGLSFSNEYATAFEHLQNVQKSLQGIENQIQKARRLYPSIVASKDKQKLADIENVMRPLEEGKAQLQEAEKQARERTIKGDAAKYAAAEAADQELMRAIQEASEARQRIEEILDTKITDMWDSQRHAADGLPQRVVVPAPLSFSRLKEMHERPSAVIGLINADMISGTGELGLNLRAGNKATRPSFFQKVRHKNKNKKRR